MDGYGPPPADGQRVYTHFKVWTNSFDNGEPITSSYAFVSPVGFVLGSPDGKVLEGIDKGICGGAADGGGPIGPMREGGWRRLIVPSALGYGEAGIASRDTVSHKAVPPNADLFIDVRLMDAGSGRCEKMLSQGVKSGSCKAGSSFG